VLLAPTPRDGFLAPNVRTTLETLVSSSLPILTPDRRSGNLAVLKSCLNARVYQLVVVQNAQDASLVMLSKGFVAALLDVKMPDMNGYQLGVSS
jgi:CheY-like chemotaxis protein